MTARLACLLLLLAVVRLPATLVERLTLEQLAERSERIVHGRCRRVWSAWDAARRNIWTHCEVEMMDSLKGGSAPLIVSEPGGLVDGVEMSVEGVSLPRSGEEVVLFLYRVPDGYWRARGLSQGKFRILRETGRPQIRSAVEGLTLVEPRTAPEAPATALRRLDGLFLDDFTAAVRAVLARPRPTPEVAR